MLEFGLLGNLQLRDSEGREFQSLFSRPKLVALLAYLAAARPLGFHRRDSIAALFWPEVDQAHARNALRQALHHLRNALGHDAIIGRGEEELGLNASEVRCDVVAFHETLDEGQPAAALELYRGELLPGFHVSDAPQFERWLDAERDHLRGRAASAAWLLAEAEEAKGNGVASAYWARRALVFAPYDESALRRLIQLLDRLGDRAGAVQEYEKFARRLGDDLEVEASPETKALIEAVRTREAVAAPHSRPLSPAPHPAPKQQTDKQPRRSAARAWFRLTARVFLGKTSLVARLVLLTLVAAVVVIVVTQPWGSGERPAVSATRIAVLPFAVRNAPQQEGLCEGMVDALSPILNGAGRVGAVDPATVLSMVGDEGCGGRGLDISRAREVAKRAGAGLFVLGGITGMGGGSLQFSATLYDDEGRDRTSTQVRAYGEDEITGAIDDLALQVISAVSPVRIDSLAAKTTQSVTALKAYLAGQVAIRAGRFDQAIDAFRRAVAEDQEFALAYYALNEAASAAWLRPRIIYNAAQQAVRYGGRLSERDSALLEASLAQQRGAWAEADRRYKAIKGAQPDDPEAWFGLAETQFHYGPLRGRSISESRAAFEEVLRINPVDGFSLYHLAVIAAVEGDFAEMDSLVQRGLSANPNHTSNLGMLTLRAFARGDTTRELVLDRLSKAGDFQVGVSVGIVSLYSGDLLGGERVAELLTDASRSPEVRSVGHAVLAHLKLARGRWDEARNQLAAAERLNHALALEYRTLLALTPFLPVPRDELEALRRDLEAWDADAVPESFSPYVLFSPHNASHRVLKMYLLGLLSARLGDQPAASQYAEQLENTSSLPWAATFTNDLALTVRAEVAYTGGDIETAVDLLSTMQMQTWYQLASVSSFYSQAYGRFRRAQLLAELGRDREAISWYGSFEHVSPFDLIYLGPALRGRGEALVRIGQQDAAIEHFVRFLTLWENCDPEFQSVWAEVNAHLTRLKAD